MPDRAIIEGQNWELVIGNSTIYVKRENLLPLAVQNPCLHPQVLAEHIFSILQGLLVAGIKGLFRVTNIIRSNNFAKKAYYFKWLEL